MWCKNYLAQNYICRKYPKVLRSLQPKNQAALSINQWPPVRYLKDYDQYQRLILDREREERPKVLKRTRNNSGCPCFSNSKGRRHSQITFDNLSNKHITLLYFLSHIVKLFCYL